jgi:PAS domain S-box-containing protein
MDQAAHLVAIVDDAGFVVYQGPAFERGLGLGADALVGAPLLEIVHPDDVDRVERLVAGALDGLEPASVSFRVCAAGGAWHTLAATASLVRVPKPLVVLDCRDTTVHSSRAGDGDSAGEEQARQARKMEALGRLAGGIAHDFSNLLTIVIGASGQLLDALPADSPWRKQAASIQTTAERAAAMTRQLLAFSRHEKSAPAVLDLNEVVRGIEQMLRPLIGEDIALETRCAPCVWPVLADRTELEQVLLNLAINARDAMPSGGRLVIATHNVDAHVDRDTGSRFGPSAAVSVRDTGVGMDDAVRARAFEPFFTTKASGKGTGFGLATVRRIVTEHLGWIDVESVPGLGTTVTFGLPKAERALVDGDRPAPETAAAPAAASETVLLVEDQDGLRELVRDMLELAGYRVLEAGAPAAAEQIGREFDGAIDLLLTDVVMPGMSGLELTARLRERRPGLPVMYMSGYPEPMMGDGGGRRPGAHFLSKPFDRRALLGAVRAALDAARHEPHGAGPHG